MTNLNEAYAELVQAETIGKNAGDDVKSAAQEFFGIVVKEADVSCESISKVLEEIAVENNLKVKVEIMTVEGHSITKKGKPATTTVGSVDASPKFKNIRAAVRRLEKSAPESITPNWTETHKAYRDLLASEQSEEEKVLKAVKSLIAETITAHCDRAEIDLQSDQAKEA